MAQFVRQALQFVRVEPQIAEQNAVRRGTDGALVHLLRYNEEVVLGCHCDDIVDHSSRRRVRVVVEKSRVDLFRDHHERQLRLFRPAVNVGEFRADVADLVLKHEGDLAFTHAISVDDDPVGQGLVDLFVLL